MAIDLVPVDGEAGEAPEPQEEVPEESQELQEAPPPELETVPTPARKRGRPAGSKNKPKPPPEPEEEEEEAPPSPKKKVRIAPPRAERLPEPKVSQAVPVEVLLRQRMVDVQARASEDRALRQAQYTEMLAKKMGFY